ncbi:single-stranded DNA-binding protein, partial [Clostridium botulinum]|nr:single-stranded DNA-binding protein [Clostridium botulinum]
VIARHIEFVKRSKANQQQLQDGYNNQQQSQNQGGYNNQQLQNQTGYNQPIQPQYQSFNSFDDNLIPPIADGDIPF